jgi:hypothetical protein
MPHNPALRLLKLLWLENEKSLYRRPVSQPHAGDSDLALNQTTTSATNAN